MPQPKRLPPEAWAARHALAWFTGNDPANRELLEGCRKTSPTAMKGMSRIANEAVVREQVVTLLRYQVSRGQIAPAIATKLEASIEEIRAAVAADRIAGDADAAEMARIRALLGQLVRWHTIVYSAGEAPRAGGGR